MAETKRSAELADDHLWNQHECADYLQFDDRKYRRLMLSGEIPRLTVGGSIRSRPGAVKEWQRCREQGEKLDLTIVPVLLPNDALLRSQCVHYLKMSERPKRPL